MKPIISESVYKKLIRLIKKLKLHGSKQLHSELNKAEIVKDAVLNDKIVSLNSTVEFLEETMNRPMSMQIVLPEEEDLKQRKISIFAPISIALIGFKESDVFNWELPSGYKKLKIIKVHNSTI